MTLTRLLALPLIWLVRAYQLVISPMTPPSCRFYPSCSAYAITALERFGPLKGTWLTVRRLLRCHPWNPGGWTTFPRGRRRGLPRTLRTRTLNSVLTLRTTVYDFFVNLLSPLMWGEAWVMTAWHRCSRGWGSRTRAAGAGRCPSSVSPSSCGS